MFIRNLALPLTGILLLSAYLTLRFASGCGSPQDARYADLPILEPRVITEQSMYDTDDPAIWIHPEDPSQSLIIGTDKDANGALYVYDLEGRIQEERVVRDLRRPNNVDIRQNVVFGTDTLDIAVTTERYENRLRAFSLPDMTPIDGGGIPVFEGTPQREPMGISLYKRPSDGALFAIVSRKDGPSGTYLWQYRLRLDDSEQLQGEKVREFGRYSGRGEIEAIAVDDELGYVYYSDEAAGVRKYHADPDLHDANVELAFFGREEFREDREGISIYQMKDGRGYILVSDQQANAFNIYPREGFGGDPHKHPMLKTVRTSTNESDGSEVTAVDLGAAFPGGLFVAMSDNRTFQYYAWNDIAGDDLESCHPE